MKISVSSLFHSDIEVLEIDYDVPLTAALAERYPQGARLQGRISRIRRGVHLQGILAGIESETCVRCLETFSRPVRIAVEETFSEEVAAEDDLFASVAPLVGREIDLTDLVSQLLEVDEPMAPLCSEDCRGICPLCGANRNLVPCACKPAAADARLAGLARLRDELA